MIRVLLTALVFIGCAKHPAPPVEPPRDTVAVERPAPRLLSELPSNKPQPFESLFFGVNADTLLPGQKLALKRLATWAGTRPLVVTGYADTTGSEAYNAALSYRRAEVVGIFLGSLGATCTGGGAGETSKFGSLRENRKTTILLGE